MQMNLLLWNVNALMGLRGWPFKQFEASDVNLFAEMPQRAFKLFRTKSLCYILQVIKMYCVAHLQVVSQAEPAHNDEERGMGPVQPVQRQEPTSRFLKGK